MYTQSWLTYKTQRQIRVDVWQLGLTFRLLQLTIAGWLIYDIFIGHRWAYHEVPAGRVNAYGQTSNEYIALGSTVPAYCGNADNPDNNYYFSATWACAPRQRPPAQVSCC